MAGAPTTWWYCLITASGEGPRKKYRSTTPPITLQGGGGRGQKTEEGLESAGDVGGLTQPSDGFAD
jgi:hypothetical protein